MNFRAGEVYNFLEKNFDLSAGIVMLIEHMIIKPKVRGFICITAYPQGCQERVEDQAAYVSSQPHFEKAPKRVLILGASTGYGLASRIVSAIGGQAATFGVFFERPGEKNKPASPGWYNTVTLEQLATQKGLPFYSMNGDAFSAKFKAKVVQALKETLKTVDCVIYSLAAPRRTDKDGTVYRSVLKPVGQSFTSKTVNTDKGEVFETTLEPASEDEIFQTVKVMGGEDWEEWIHLLAEEHLLEPHTTTIAYSYIGPEVTWPIYKSGTIGQAKLHLTKTAEALNAFLRKECQGRALVSVNKAVVTQASSAIPVVPLYNSVLFKVMKEKGLHEDCIQQIYRLFAGLFDGTISLKHDSDTCVRLDDRELLPEVQNEVQAIWSKINTDNLRQLSDYDGYQKSFLQLFGFECPGVDYDAEVDPQRPMKHLL